MNNVKTKLKKNYLALTILIAVLGVISAALFSVISFADINYEKCDDLSAKSNINDNNDFCNNNQSNESYTYTQKGKLTLPTGKPMPNASVTVWWQSDVYGRIIPDYVKTDMNGYFVSTFNSELTQIAFYGIQSSFTVGECEYYVSDTVGHGDDYMTPSNPVHEYTGDKTIARYLIKGDLKINNDSPFNNEAGKWTYEYLLIGAETEISPETMPINLDHKNGSYEINGGSSIVFHNAWFPFEDGWACELVLRAYANEGYYIKNIEIVDNQGSVCPASGVLTKSNYIVNVNILPKTQLHTITFGENISKVLANGVEITSGAEVEEGTSLQIIPAVVDNKVTKVYVNDSICPTCQTTVNSNIDIEGQLYDSVKLSGKVVTGEEQVDAFKAVSKIFVDKAYAAESGIEGAVITFTDATDGWYTSTISDDNGEFELDVVQGNAGTLSVYKDGYDEYSKEINGNDLEDDYLINPVLKAVNIDPNPENNNLSAAITAQTGDNALYAIFFMIIITSAFILFSLSKRNSYKQVE